MVQARRKPQTKPKRKQPSSNRANIAMLLVGMLIGSLGTVLWHGATTVDSSIGGGIRRIMQLFEVPTESPSEGQDGKNIAQQPHSVDKPSTEFTFFTVLPEIEVVAPSQEQEVAIRESDRAAQADAANAPTTAASAASYHLQAGSYRRRKDADQLKARLALHGLISSIQKVSIQGRGDFYRVRLGPYPNYQAMLQADQQLRRSGFEKALRLKMVNAG